VEECLPAELRGPSTTISKVSAGLSGAGVYRVDSGAGAFVLKIAADASTVEAWRRKVRVQQLAADAGLAPRVVHVDEERRAVVSDFLADRGFIAMFRDPRNHGAAMQQLDESVRRVHGLPLPDDAEPADGLNFLAGAWSGLAGGFPLPAFVRDAAQQLLAEQPPTRDRALVMSHNDVNPTNLAHDGTRLLFLDWDTAAPNDPWFDLASIAVFLRMDAESCRRLIAAYEGAPVTSLPARFDYDRRLVAAMCGILGLRMARLGGHGGATGTESLETTPGLGEFYQRLRAGQLNLATPEGQWSFGLALVKESVVLRENADG
jgi:aminoglycoside phosphotransferase (APT) family kinase protein